MAETAKPNVSPVLIRRVIRTAPKQEARPNRIKLLISIVNRGDDNKLQELLNDFSVSLAFSCMGTGTARSAVLNYLGIGTSQKSVMFSLIPESDEIAILDRIRDEMSLYLVGRGISFTIPLSAASEIIAGDLTAAAAAKTVEGRNIMRDKDRNYDLIVAIVTAGYVDEAMEAARSVGAAGGTIIRARAVKNEKAEQFIGIPLHIESEMLLILSQRSDTDMIMNTINDKVGLKSEARGIIYSLPVDRTVGVGASSERSSAQAEKPAAQAEKPVAQAEKSAEEAERE